MTTSRPPFITANFPSPLEHVSTANDQTPTLFTCKHCSHSSTLQDEVQKEAALAQALQVLQAVAAAALAQVVTCERMFLN
jgi:hypothetical protein